MNISEAIKHLASNGDELYLKIGKVTATDKQRRTCDVAPLDGSAPLLSVKLQAGEAGKNGITVWPKQGTHVIVGFLNPNAGCVLLTEETEHIEAIAGQTTFTMDSQGITLNGGNLGGLVNISELQANLESLKNYCAALKTAVSNGLTAVGIGLEADGGTAAATFNTEIAKSQITLQEMEDTKVKH